MKRKVKAIPLLDYRRVLAVLVAAVFFAMPATSALARVTYRHDQ